MRFSYPATGLTEILSSSKSGRAAAREAVEKTAFRADFFAKRQKSWRFFIIL